MRIRIPYCLRRELPYPFHVGNRKDIIRIHITKTAGTSLSRAMNFNRPDKARGRKKHWFAKEIITEVGQEQWDQAFKFTFVRNPWDRMFSLYRFQLRKGKIAPESAGNSFRKWLIHEVEVLHSEPYFKSQSQVDWLLDFDGNMNYDFIGRFENLHKDAELLGQKLNMKIKLPHVNQSLPIIHYSSAYDDELIELVNINYRKDIERFNYSFEKMSNE